MTPSDSATLDAAYGVVLPLAYEAAAPHSLRAYIGHTFPEYDLQPHHSLLIERLEAVERGDVKRLMVFMPPQRGKSECVSVRFPAWYHGRHPDRNVMQFSYGADLTYDFSRQVRDQIALPEWPFSAVQLKPGEKSVGQWGLAGHRGRHIANGVLGGATGKGAHLAIIDDPVKNDVEAKSPVYQERVWQWYNKVVRTRMSGDGAIVLCMTRWDDGDLAGRLLDEQKRGGDKWEVVTLKELAEEGDNDPLGRAPGDVLWPARFPPETTAAIRQLQPHTWEPLYQQRPGAVSGGMFKRGYMDYRYDPAVLPHFGIVVQTVDSAFKDDISADWSVVATWGATLTHFYLLDVARDKLQFPDLLKLVADQYSKWQRLAPWVYIEDKASGQSAIQQLRRGSNIPVIAYNPGQAPKASRAQDATPYFAAGRVLLPESAPWLADWIDEHVRFPGGIHDDCVDTTSMACKILARATGIGLDDLVTRGEEPQAVAA